MLEEGDKQMVGNEIQSIVGKLNLNAGRISILVRMRNNTIRCEKFKYGYIKIIYISEL